jgi:hypothetical protein
MSLLELRAMPRRWDALGNKQLPDVHREFLSHLTINDRGWPMYNGRVAGLNACFVLTPKN